MKSAKTEKTTKTVKIGLSQLESKLKDVKYNIKQACESVARLAKNGADIVCFGELFATGYNLMSLSGKPLHDLIATNYDFCFQSMSKAAKDNHCYLIAPFGSPCKTGALNDLTVFGRNGEVIGSYAKNHLWALEALNFTHGDGYLVFDTDFGRVGVMICYDAGFPEVARILMLKGAQIIFAPSAWRVQDEDMWDLNLAQRALENICFTVGVNLVANHENLTLFGRSKICNPRGTTIHQLAAFLPDERVCEIDLGDVDKYRELCPYLKDRKASYGL